VAAGTPAICSDFKPALGREIGRKADEGINAISTEADARRASAVKAPSEVSFVPLSIELRSDLLATGCAERVCETADNSKKLARNAGIDFFNIRKVYPTLATGLSHRTRI
jgi:hypothetical protein